MSGLTFRRSLAGFGPSLIRAVFDAAPSGALNMGLGMPDLEVPPSVIAAVQQELTTGRAPYSPNAGRPQLRAEIASLYQSWSQEVGAATWIAPEGVIVTAGAEEALYVALASLCEPGDEVLVPDPGFPAYAMIARCIGAKVQTYPLDPETGFRPTASALLEALTPNTRAVVLGSPANPTGVMVEPEELELIALALASAGVPWVSDEIYDRYTWSTPFVSPGRFTDQGMVVGGLSKSASMMGWRLGWLMVPAGQAQIPTAVHQSICSCASTLSQAAARAAVTALMGQGPDAGYMDQAREQFRDRRQRMVHGVEALGLRYAPADGAFYLFVEVAAHTDEDDVALCHRLAREQALIAIPGQAFGPRGSGWVRLAYTCEAVEEGLARLARGLGIGP
ncbi:MAG: pyridoxal phosphate-dependent aminotransferase [Myxococcota bacterium]